MFQQVNNFLETITKLLQETVTVLLCLIVSVTTGRENRPLQQDMVILNFTKTHLCNFYQYNSLSESRTRLTSSRKALSRSVCL